MTKFKYKSCETCRFADLIHAKCEQCNQGEYKPDNIQGTDEYQPTEWFSEILALEARCDLCPHHKGTDHCYCGYERINEKSTILCKSCGKPHYPWTCFGMCKQCYDDHVKNHFLLS